jgi:AraC family transcriptional regulator
MMDMEISMPGFDRTSNDKGMTRQGSPIRELRPADQLSTSKRVSVLVDGRSVPLLPSYPIKDGARSPWTGIILEKHRLDAVAIPEHEHSTFCLHLQSSGPVDMDWYSAGRSGHLKTDAGNLIFLTPGTRDSLLWHGPSHRLVVSLEPSLLSHAAEQLGIKGTCGFENLWSFQDEQLRLLLTEMEREMNSGWPMGSLYGDLLGMSLSIALIKKYGRTSSILAAQKGGLSRSNLRRVLAYIDGNLDRDIRLQELAILADLSVFHFARSFRESVGSTPHQYIVNMRVQKAKTLLTLPEWSIQQIASATGFADGGHLSKIFRKSTGVSPTAWRRMS